MKTEEKIKEARPVKIIGLDAITTVLFGTKAIPVAVPEEEK